MGRLQVDHIQPVSRGGTDTESNLCLACELCNQNKWARTEAIDPDTETSVLLFNPRQQSWSEHFAWSVDGTEVIGLTSCGRATIVALRLNNSLAVTVRKIGFVQDGTRHPKSKSVVV